MKRPLSLRGVEAAGLFGLLVAGGPGALVAGAGVLGVALPAPTLRPFTWTIAHGGALLAAGLVGIALGSAAGLALLVTWLLVHRAWTGHRPDDARVSLLLATLLLLLGAVGTDSVLLAPAMMAYGAFLPLALLRAELGDVPTPLRLRVGLAVLCGILGAAFFVALPRLDGGYLGHRDSGRQFPDKVSLGDEGLVNDEGAEVLRMRVTTPEGTVLPGPFHLRGRSLERFDGRRWTVGSTVDRARGRHWDVVAEVQTAGPSELLFGIPDVVTVNGIAARLDPGGAWVPRAPSRTLHYFVRSRNVVLDEVRADDGRLLQLPDDLDRRIYPLAWSILPEEEDPDRLAHALIDWLEANYRYEETPGEPVGDPLAWFLFDSKAGHCEYFASALTVFLRVRGVPARLATGFYSEEVDPDGWIVVREGNAHAWVEVPVTGGWATLDPTPPSGLPEVDGDSLGARVDMLLARWYQDVVEYDMNAQFAAYGAIGRRFLFATGSQPAEGSLRAGLLGMLLVVVGLVVGLGVGRVVVNRLGGPARRNAGDPVARLAAEARRRVRARGWPLPAELPLVEAGAWLRERVGDDAAALERFADLVYRARYGGQAVPLGELRGCVSALGRIPRPSRLTTPPSRG